jgi:ribonuclease HI
VLGNSQAAVKAIEDNLDRQLSKISLEVLMNSQTNTHTYIYIEIIWISGHAEIEGNERADTGKNGSDEPHTTPTAQL